MEGKSDPGPIAVVAVKNVVVGSVYHTVGSLHSVLAGHTSRSAGYGLIQITEPGLGRIYRLYYQQVAVDVYYHSKLVK